MGVFCVCVTLLALCVTVVPGNVYDHTYEEGEQVVLWFKTVGPLHNKQEAYYYFSLHFCFGFRDTSERYHETLSETLQGVRLLSSGVDISYKKDVSIQDYCTVKLNEQLYEDFVHAVKNNYWYQMYIDDLPIWGAVGKADGNNYYIWGHKSFSIGYNGDRIVDVNLTSKNRIKLTPDAMIPFSYEVIWKESNFNFEDRFDKYLDPNFFQHRNQLIASITFIFLVGFIIIFLMWKLRVDYARQLDDVKNDLEHEYGWNQVHGDVFRPVPHLALFCSLIGSGYQLTIVVLSVILLNIFCASYNERGVFLSTIIYMYAATSVVNGYFGGSLYARMGGGAWIRQLFLSVFMLPVIVYSVGLIGNFIAVYYRVSQEISTVTMTTVVCICVFVILPLTLFGTVLARKFAGQPNFPCKINVVPRPIPEKKWFMEPLVFVLLGGVLPFGSVCFEMYYILTSFWTYKIYHTYGFMLLVFIIFMMVVTCVTVVSVYLLLNTEDHRWQWTSFLSAGSTAAYVYLYSIFYFLFKTRMYGLFQITFYFGYMALFSLGLGVMCGTMGYLGSSIFVRKIYSTLKID